MRNRITEMRRSTTTILRLVSKWVGHMSLVVRCSMFRSELHCSCDVGRTPSLGPVVHLEFCALSRIVNRGDVRSKQPTSFPPHSA